MRPWAQDRLVQGSPWGRPGMRRGTGRSSTQGQPPHGAVATLIVGFK